MSVEMPQIPWTSPASEISGTFLDRSNRSPAGVFDISSDSDSLPVIMAATSLLRYCWAISMGNTSKSVLPRHCSRVTLHSISMPRLRKV